MHASRTPGPFGAPSSAGPAGAFSSPDLDPDDRTLLRDLGALFGAAGGYAQIALLDVEADHPAREAIEMIARVLWRAENASHDLLAEDGDAERLPRRTDLCRVAREVAAIAEGLAPPGVAVALAVPAEAVPTRVDDGALVRTLVRCVSVVLAGLEARGGRVGLTVVPPSAPGAGGELRLSLPPLER